MPYKDINKKREVARLSAQKSRKLNPEKHKETNRKSRLKNYDVYLKQKRRHYQKHREYYLQKAKDRKRSEREIIFNHYGGKCSCCGEKEYAFLTIEHKLGGGVKHRKEIGAANVPRYIIKNNFPDEFDVLCYNCNCAKAFNKICPHKI